MQRGRELWEGSEHSQDPLEAVTGSREWGCSGQLWLQPDLPQQQQQLPTLPAANRSRLRAGSGRGLPRAWRAPRRLLNGFYGGI